MKYENIINLPHYELKYHKRMIAQVRAAQFSPFAALTGYSESIKETSRMTERKIELSEDIKNKINESLLIINNNIKNKPLIRVLYFEKDKKKSGGKHIEYECNVKEIDSINKCIIFTDRNKIYFKNIIYIYFF